MQTTKAVFGNKPNVLYNPNSVVTPAYKPTIEAILKGITNTQSVGSDNGWKEGIPLENKLRAPSHNTSDLRQTLAPNDVSFIPQRSRPTHAGLPAPIPILQEVS